LQHEETGKTNNAELYQPSETMIPIRDTIPSKNFPFVTLLIIASNAAVFLWELSLPDVHLEKFISTWAMIPSRFFHPDFSSWISIPKTTLIPVFSSMFLHGGWLHFIGNMWTLHIFGDNVEDRLGHFRFLLFYIVSGVAAQFLHLILHAVSPIPTIGASGAIAGIMGAYFVLFPMAQVVVLVPIFIYPLFFEVPAVFYLFIWFATQLYSGVFSLGVSGLGGVAFWAHIGGFIAGIVLLLVFLPRKKKTGKFKSASR